MESIFPVDGYALDDVLAAEVCAYRNLKAGAPHGWSIARVKGNDNRGTVIAHADAMTLVGVRTMVKESRRKAIADGGYKEVCAWFVGKIADADIPAASRRKVTFHPRERATFYTVADGTDVTHADAVTFTPDGQAWL
jgi:hypothetical protein